MFCSLVLHSELDFHKEFLILLGWIASFKYNSIKKIIKLDLIQFVLSILFPYLFIHNISQYSLLYPFENPSQLFKNHFSTHWMLCANWDQSKLSTFWRNFPQRLQLVLYFLALASVPDVFEVEYRTIFFLFSTYLQYISLPIRWYVCPKTIWSVI